MNLRIWYNIGMIKKYLFPFLAMLMLSSAYGEGELNRFVDFEKNAAELKFIENPDFWAKEVDFSALSVWNDATKDMWGGGCERRNLAGVAISPRHVLCSHHYGIPTGTTLYFLGPKSGVVGRKVLASDYVAQGADLRVCLLDVDLPRDIVPLKILPENYADYLGDGKGLISATMNQYRELITQKLLSIPGEENRTQLLSATKPTQVEDAAKYKTVISGDSGCPRFLIVDNEPVLISLMWKGGSGSGVFIPHFRREIQNTMNRLAKGYELGEVSLAALPLYTPPSTEIKSPAPSPAAPNSENDNSGADNGSDDEDDIYDFIIIEDEYDDGEDEVVERVDIAAIVCTNGVVDIEFKWPSTMQINKWDVFLKGYAELNGEVTLSKKYNPASGTNLVVSVTATDFPESVLPHNYFFKAEAVKDSDHDGLSDVDEIAIGTNPYNADSDSDGLTDTFELNNNMDPTNDDMDGDGVRDGEECNNGTLPWIDEAEMETLEGTYYVITGTVHEEELPYDPSTNQTSRVASDELPPNQPGIFSNIGYEIQDVTSNIFCKVKSGLKFCPTQDGYFAFQIAADDRAEVTIGNLKITDEWYTRGQEKIGYFKAGQEYEMTAKIWNNGGRTYLNFPKFAECKYFPVLMENELTKSTIIFESSYENRPNEIIPSNTTEVKSTVQMTAGILGGRLEIDVEGYEKIRLLRGQGLPEHLDINLGAGEAFTRVGYYGGAARSEDENDVKIKVKFTENETGQSLQWNETLTVYQVDVKAVDDRDAEYRHIFGPLEYVSISYKPDDTFGTWQYTCAEVSSNENPDGSQDYVIANKVETLDMGIYFRTLIEEASYSATLSINGVPLTIPLQVINPKGRVGDNPRDTLAGSQLMEHWCEYVMDVYLLPRYVSFSQIRIKEGFCESTNSTGSLSFGADYPHNDRAGAGRIVKVQDTNQAGIDTVTVQDVHMTNGTWRGTNDWRIPVYWQPKTEATNHWSRTTPFTHNTQAFRCDRNGKLSIQKMKCYGSRDLEGHTEYKTLK